MFTKEELEYTNTRLGAENWQEKIPNWRDDSKPQDSLVNKVIQFRTWNL